MLPTLFAWMLVAQVGSDSAALPGVDEVIAKMVQRDQERRSAFQGDTSVRQYVRDNTKYHKQASMIVRMTQGKDGSKEFKILTSSGWSGARKHVFPRLLEAEGEASRPGNPEDSRVTPQNYSFSCYVRSRRPQSLRPCAFRRSKQNIDARNHLGRCRRLRHHAHGR
jgi:hypothetical protein